MVCLSQTAEFSSWLRFMIQNIHARLCEVSAELGGGLPYNQSWVIWLRGQLWVQVWTPQWSIWELISQTWATPIDRLATCEQALDLLLCELKQFELAFYHTGSWLLELTPYAFPSEMLVRSFSRNVFQALVAFLSCLADNENMSWCSFLAGQIQRIHCETADSLADGSQHVWMV